MVAALGVITLNKSVLSLNKTNLDEDKSMTITHYFMMGLNEDTEGVFNGDDAVYSQSFENKATRKEGNLQVIKQRFQKMGVTGYVIQLVKKNLSNYNDGTFAWAREGNFFGEIPEKNNAVSTFLRKIYYWYAVALIVKVVVSKNIYFLFLQVIRYCSVPDVSINKLSTFIGNHVRNRILPDHHHFE